LGLGLNIALFVGIPAVVIVGLGLVFTRFRGEILGGASAVGTTFAGIFTRPVTGFIETISSAFSDLPDIDIQIPGINLTGGLFTFTQEASAISPGNIIPGTDVLQPGETPEGVTIPEGCRVNPDGTISCDTPPTATDPTDPASIPGFIPTAEGSELTPFAESFLFQTSPDAPLMRGSLEEILAVVPGAIGLFDFIGTPQVEFIPVAENQLEFFGESIRFSGQLFQEISGA